MKEKFKFTPEIIRMWSQGVTEFPGHIPEVARLVYEEARLQVDQPGKPQAK